MATDIKAGTVHGWNWIYKYITVSKLKSILDTLPDDSELVPNSVGNLSVYDKIEGGFMIRGYIDISEEELKV